MMLKSRTASTIKQMDLKQAQTSDASIGKVIQYLKSDNWPQVKDLCGKHPDTRQLLHEWQTLRIDHTRILHRKKMVSILNLFCLRNIGALCSKSCTRKWVIVVLTRWYTWHDKDFTGQECKPILSISLGKFVIASDNGNLHFQPKTP